MSATILLKTVDDLINRFSDNHNNITIVSQVIQTETFGDDYHDFDLRALMQNKELMQQIADMEQEESKQSATADLKCHLPLQSELDVIRQSLNAEKDIEIIDNSSIRNFEGQFQIDRFKFSIQFMIFPKSFIHCWIGFIGSKISNSESIAATVQSGHSGGIGGQQMGGPMMSSQPEHVIKEHYLSNLMLTIPHRKPLSDEFGTTNMSSIALLSESMPEMDVGMNEENHFKLSSNDLAMKLSKMLSKRSQSTVQISCDIPSQIINVSMRNARYGMRRDDMHRIDDNMCFLIEKKILSMFKDVTRKT